MGLDQIPTAFAAQYANWLAGLLFILLLLLVIRSRSNRFRKAWRPLIPVVRGRLKKQRAKATMTGSYHGRTVTANACNEAGGTETFTVEMPVESGGRDWEI